MRGLHLTADLYQCRCEGRWLTDAQQLGQFARQAAEAVGLVVEREMAHVDASGGAMAALLLAGSHVCLHTWPQERGVTVDVCLAHAQDDFSAKARGLMFALVQRFQPEWTEQRSLDRGDGE
ncbi:S-adenosylmethionine decarboxylase family protein [Ramlibacter sp. Leaf400]|uniref:S-adenosylmethionine decarboxylase family protein n=1 Tax=Ramlibacter sp. Leaf400 TaxID=1736365 RepID=UPI0006FE33E2|nr:S-adenosylmethionine decarboxylase [Ramlibacter sp. Leaf400]KQT12344.1 S-adenosylmethionine decarboxylase proenzyme [Ramlibacter sp. Leaf400]